ncbi:hypothetical protein KR044_008785, partial [Drosophila immigrans]
MSVTNFVETIQCLAFSLHSNSDRQYLFMTDATLIVDAIIAKLESNHSPFKDYMQPMRRASAAVQQINLDLPLSFEVFLPIRLPYALSAQFDQQERSVRLKRPSIEHPFFFGNMLNAKFMNFLLQRDLQQAVAELCTVHGNCGAIYDVQYSALSYNHQPFAHQIYAAERGTDGHAIHIDFILALEFDGAEMPLPAYYRAPLTYKWLAFGLVSVGDQYDGSTWAVLLPRWQTDMLPTRLRCLRMMQLLYRLLYAQRCFCFAVPLLIKFSFCMTTADRGDDYKRMSVAELMITALGHQVFRNFCELIVASKVGDPMANIESTKSLREQQVRCKGIFAMLAKGFQLNAINSDLLNKFFQLVE